MQTGSSGPHRVTSRIAFFVACPLFLLCLVLDAVCLTTLPDDAIAPLAIWLAIEIYWLVAFGTLFLRGPRNRDKEPDGKPNQASHATSEPAQGAASSPHGG